MRDLRMDAGTLIMVVLIMNVLNCLEIIIEQGSDSIQDIQEYKNPKVSDQILKIVLSADY